MQQNNTNLMQILGNSQKLNNTNPSHEMTEIVNKLEKLLSNN